jgi:hypothetical protein
MFNYLGTPSGIARCLDRQTQTHGRFSTPAATQRFLPELPANQAASSGPGDWRLFENDALDSLSIRCFSEDEQAKPRTTA